LGETLLNLPLVAALKQTYPTAKLTWLVAPDLVELFSQAPGADRVLGWLDEPSAPWWQRAWRLSRWLRTERFDLAVVSNPKKEYHVAVWLAGISTRVGYDRKGGQLLTQRIPDRKAIGERHEIEYNLELLNALGLLPPSPPVFTLPESQDERALSMQLFDRLKVMTTDRLVAVHPWTSNPRKQWPMPRFRQLIERLAERSTAVPIVIGGREEQSRVQEVIGTDSGRVVDAVGRLSLPQLAGLLRRVQVLVSNDSGPMHLAAAVGTPVVALFGTAEAGSTPRRWGPWGSQHTVIHQPLVEISVDDVLAPVGRYLGQG
jgi:ADP-heptose:LPS heptosyltransferase